MHLARQIPIADFTVKPLRCRAAGRNFGLPQEAASQNCLDPLAASQRCVAPSGSSLGSPVVGEGQVAALTSQGKTLHFARQD